MRIIKRTFANLSKTTLLLGKAGENLKTRLEIDISKEQSEFTNPVFELVLKMPSATEPYPVFVEIVGNTMSYTFTGSDLLVAGNGEVEALVSGANGEVYKSATAQARIDPSIIQNAYPGPIQKVIDDINERIAEISASGIQVVDSLPLNPDTDEIVYLRNTGLYWFNGTAWVQLTNELVSAADKANWNDAYDKRHTHSNKTTLDKINEYNGQMIWNGQAVATKPITYNPTLLSFRDYTQILVRSDIQGLGSVDDVPIYNTVDDNDFEIGLYEDLNDIENCDSVVLTDLQDDGMGVPVRLLRVQKDGVVYARWSHYCTILGNSFNPNLWYTNNVQTIAPDMNGFQPTVFTVCSEPFEDLSDLPDYAAAALYSLSQIINEDGSYFGDLSEPKDNAIIHLAGQPKANRKYSMKASLDITFEPNVPEDVVFEDQQFVLYLTCSQDIDVTFPAGTLFAGDPPNTDTGIHKIIGTYLQSAGTWMIGSIDYAEAAS